MRAVQQDEKIHVQLLGLQLGAHLQGYARAEGVAGQAVGPLGLGLPHARHVEGGQRFDAAQRGGWGGGGGVWLDVVVQHLTN